jgi:hypothetical protein
MKGREVWRKSSKIAVNLGGVKHSDGAVGN